MSIMPMPIPEDLDPEIGHPGGLAPSWHPTLGPGYMASAYEDNPALAFPASIGVYDQMRKTEGKVAGLLRAIVQTVVASLANARVEDHPDVRPEIGQLVATELGLHRLGKRAPRRALPEPAGVNWLEHCTQALLAVPLGFAPFFKLWQPGPATSDQADVAAALRALRGDDTVVHLAKLGPRLPRTISEIRTDRYGNLTGVVQAGIGWDTAGRGDGVRVIGGPGMDDTLEQWIPARDLLFYCFEREGADWAGSSILRSSYGAWRLKTEAIKTDAMAGERNGMGLPAVYYGEDGTREEALAIATAARAGAAAGVALKKGTYELKLQGVEGQVRDILASAKYHDQAIAESALAHVLTLGHEGGIGQGSVADTFQGLFAGGLNAIQRWLLETINDGLVRELVALNFPGEAYPVICADEIEAESVLTAEALKSLVDAQVIHPDPGLEADTRRKYRLPAAPEGVTVDNTPGEDLSPGTLDPVAFPGGDYVRDQGAVDDPSGVLDPVAARALSAAERIVQLRQAAAHLPAPGHVPGHVSGA